MIIILHFTQQCKQQINVTEIFYIANEAISVIENAGVLGLPILQKLLDVLAQLRDKGDKGDDNK